MRDVIAEPLDLRYFAIAVGVAVAHLITGMDILIAGNAVLAITPLHFLSSVIHSEHWTAAVLMITAMLAVVPFLCLRPPRLLFVVMIAPQQILLMFHFISVAIAVSGGSYPDGYVPAAGGYFIFADQIWLLMIITVHTLGYIKCNLVGRT